MFQMQLNEAFDFKSPNKLTLTNVEIINMFYALNSIVGLTSVQGIVVI